VDTVLPVYAGSRALERLDNLDSNAAPALSLRSPRPVSNAHGVADVVARARIPRRFGYARDGREALLTDPIPVPSPPCSLHMVFYYWGLAAAVGGGDVPARARLGGAPPHEVPRILGRDSRTAPRVQPTDEMLEAARRRLRRVGLAGRPLVAVAPGAAHGSAKRWPAVHFDALCRQLARELGQRARMSARSLRLPHNGLSVDDVVQAARQALDSTDP
jgi:heptosyltransferase II